MVNIGEIVKSVVEEILGETDETKQAREIEDLAEELRSQRLNWEKRWLLADRFAAGNHFEVWRPATNEIGKVVFPKGMNVRPIHSAIRTVEGTLNNLISADPQWKVFPHGLTTIKNQEEREAKIEHARQIGFYFDDAWDGEGMRGKVSEMVWNGLKYCFGVLEVYWENGKPRVRSIEPFDILFDPTVKDIRYSSVVIKEVSVPLDEIRANEKYNDNKNLLKADGKQSGSGFKESRLTEKHGRSTGKGKALIREAWLRNPTGGWDTKHVSQGKLLYSNHYNNWTRSTFASWKLNFEPLLQTSWFERLIPLNRGLDVVLAQIEMWVRSVAVGRMLRKKGTSIDRIMGEHGEIIEVDGLMDNLRWLQTGEIGSTPFNYMAELKSLISEIGASSASIGRVPRGGRAGYKMIESLKASEMSSIQHGVRALEDSLESLAEVMLMLINTFGETPIEVRRKDEAFEIVGKDFAKGFSGSVAVSDVDFGVNVSIESGLAYTTEARREMVVELAKLKIIPIKTALDYLGIGGDTEEIARMAMEEYERMEKAKLKTESPKSILDAEDWGNVPPELQQQVLETLGGQLE
ncbi:MAG: hypothetical protein DDT40_01336 [candidate division WS2 bacterium]|nr:hypothetical protein [Candidatus Psychracetigena formicireducens]